jgi:leucyl aminopeptidase
MTPAFAESTAVSRPLYVVAAEDLAGFLQGQSEAVRGWLAGQGFEAALGDLRLIPGADGVAAAVIGFGTGGRSDASSARRGGPGLAAGDVSV